MKKLISAAWTNCSVYRSIHCYSTAILHAGSSSIKAVGTSYSKYSPCLSQTWMAQAYHRYWERNIVLFYNQHIHDLPEPKNGN